MRSNLRSASVLALVVLGVFTSGRTATACPFCSAVSQTLRQEMATMDAVVIAESIQGSERDPETGEIPLRVVRVLKGADYIKPGATVRSVYYGSVEPGRRFMLSGVEPKQLMWSSPLPVDEREEAYISKVLELPEDDAARLRFFHQYLEDESTMLARDAYDEFAVAPLDALKKIKDLMDHDQLVRWIQEPEMPADRRRLYLVMLSVCGDKSDVPMLESMLRSTQRSARTGLDALIACYLTLAGPEGLPVINELFLANSQAPYADTYGAVMAVRFHGTEEDIIPRADLVKSLHHVLERPDLADLVISDLARWGDWTQIDRLVELFKTADPENNWVRVPVVNYMRACPLPEAKQALETLKEIDPEAVKRANTFFSAPVPPADTQEAPDSSSTEKPWAANLAQVSTAVAPGKGPLADAGTGSAIALNISGGNGITDAASQYSSNPWRALSVIATAVASLMIMGYLVISGGPQPSVEPAPVDARQ